MLKPTIDSEVVDTHRLEELNKFKVSLEKAVLYNPKFDAFGVKKLVDAAVPPKYANQFDPKEAEGWDIAPLYLGGVSYETAKSYGEVVPLSHGSIIAEYVARKITPHQIKQYLHKDPEVVFTFFGKNISPETANSYLPEFPGFEVFSLIRENMLPEEARGYPSEIFTSCNLPSLKQVGILPDSFSNEQQKKNLIEVLKAIVQNTDYVSSNLLNGESNTITQNQDSDILELFSYRETAFSFNPRVYSFVDAGYTGIVLFNNHTHRAYKITANGEDESQVLSLAADGRVNSHVINLISVVDTNQSTFSKNIFVFELEYIRGDSLHKIIERVKPFPKERTIRYSVGILNGLLELRQAGIWHHRDIRPANIMIDEEKDRAVIIDLGLATTNKDALAEDNRRFGSPSGRRANDLTSLGQVVYKMATGEHIFAESKSMERTTYADKLRDQRDWIYERPEERLQPYLRKVEETVKDRDLCEIVNFCLTSEGLDEDYKVLEARFNEYGA